MPIFQKRKKQAKKPSQMKSVKRHVFSGFSDDLLGGVVRESLNGHSFTFDTITKKLTSGSQVIY